MRLILSVSSHSCLVSRDDVTARLGIGSFLETEAHWLGDVC